MMKYLDRKLMVAIGLVIGILIAEGLALGIILDALVIGVCK